VLRLCSRIIIAALSFLYLFVGYVLALLSGIHIAVAVTIFVLSLTACAAFVLMRFTVRGRRTFARNLGTDWAGTIAVAMGLVALGTAGFAALSTGLYNVGIGSTGGTHLHGARHVVGAAYSYYLFHLADAVPLLKVPETLNWKLKHPFTDSLNGSLVLVYTVLVAIPLIWAATQIVRRFTSDAELKATATDRDET
jgi:hypothetical protein